MQATTGEAVESITFELANSSDRTVCLNPYAWRLERKTDEGWTYVAPGEHIEPWYHLESGDSCQWQLSVEEQTGSDVEQTNRIVEDLQSGLYAFGIDGVLGDVEEDGARIEWVALFVVDP
jgi:hypothetical protein